MSRRTPAAQRALLLLGAGLTLGLGLHGAGCGAAGDGAATDGPTAGAGQTHGDDAQGGNTPKLQELLTAWQGGTLERAALTAGLEGLAGVAAGSPWALPTKGALLLGPGVHQLSGDKPLAAGGVLVLGPGAELVLAADATWVVNGQLYAFGTAQDPAAIRGEDGKPYEVIRLSGGRSELHHTGLRHGKTLLDVRATKAKIRLQACDLEHWALVALTCDGADGLEVKDSRFGLQSEGEPHGEAIQGKTSALVVQGCEFGKLQGYADAIDLESCAGHTPWLTGNRFRGGQDDGIDLDWCDAVVVGNLLQDFWPGDPSKPSQGVNGGGITGHASSPLLINNVIQRCFHGIGFKNESRPVMLHNTVVDGNIGLTLYRTNDQYGSPHGLSIDNIFWNNRAWNDKAVVQDVVLHGRWWSSYDPSPGDQATLDALHTVAGTALNGLGNLQKDPQLVAEGGLPIPAAGSPAAASALGPPYTFGAPFDQSPLATAHAGKLAATDHLGKPRPSASAADRGALQRQESKR